MRQQDSHSWQGYYPVKLKLIGTSLSEPHTSVPALRTHVCMLVCLFVWTDYLSWSLNERIQIISRWWNVHTDTYFSEQLSKSRENEHERVLPDCRVVVKENKSEDDLSRMHWQHAWQFCELWYDSDDCMTRQAMSDPGWWPSDSRMYAGFRYVLGMTALT